MKTAPAGLSSAIQAGRTSGPETAVDPMTVPIDDAAQARFDAPGDEITAEIRAGTRAAAPKGTLEAYGMPSAFAE